jgi:hypothetical protein
MNKIQLCNDTKELVSRLRKNRKSILELISKSRGVRDSGLAQGTALPKPPDLFSVFSVYQLVNKEEETKLKRKISLFQKKVEKL